MVRSDWTLELLNEAAFFMATGGVQGHQGRYLASRSQDHLGPLSLFPPGHRARVDAEQCCKTHLGQAAEAAEVRQPVGEGHRIPRLC